MRRLIIAASLLVSSDVFAQDTPPEPNAGAPVAPPTAGAMAAPPETPVPPPIAPAPPADPAIPPAAQPTAPLPQPSALPAPMQRQFPPQDEPMDWQLYGGIAIAGAGAALLVVAGVAVSRIDQLEDDPGFIAYRAGFDVNQDVCREAEGGARVDGAASPEDVVDLCDEATRWEITNYVALPGGVALLGLGLYLSLTSDTAMRDSPVSFIPLLGPGNAGAAITGRF